MSTAQQPRTEPKDPVDVAFEWIKRHRNPLIAAAAIVVAVGFSVWFFLTAQQRKEAFAAAELANSRAVAAAGNLALAASDLEQLVNSYGGTTAGEEAAILLAQIRLTEKQPDAAAAVIRRLIDAGPSSQFLAPAYGLLGNALDESGDLAGAAQAYLDASQAAWYDFLGAEYLLDAARMYEMLGDTTTAISTYRRIVSDYDKPGAQQSVVEARVRLSELLPTEPDIAS